MTKTQLEILARLAAGEELIAYTAGGVSWNADSPIEYPDRQALLDCLSQRLIAVGSDVVFLGSHSVGVTVAVLTRRGRAALRLQRWIGGTE